MIARFLKKSGRRKASSLVTTLLVIAVLAVIVVAFMQSMNIERMTARSYANKYTAELLADAATEDAINRILTTIETVPYSAAYYSNSVAGAETRHLYLARYTNQTSSLATLRVPLFSTLFTNFSVFTNMAQPPVQTNSYAITDRDERTGAVTRNPSAARDLYTDLNRTNFYFPQGIIGLTNTTGSITLPGNWIYQTNALGQVIGRYAFWVDDESSKIDLRTAGLSTNTNGVNLTEISLSAFTNSGLSPAQLTNLFNFKSQTIAGKSPSFSRYALGPGGQGISNAVLWNKVRPYVTQYSLHDLRSPDGNLSLNLNSFVTTTTNAARIQQEVETLATAITNNLPSFGERYYQVTTASSTPTVPTTADQLAYVKKIAANIRDYIDTDNTATVIMEDGSAYTGTAPDFIPYETIIDDIPIVGKERGPFLNEYNLATRVITPATESATASGNVDITVRFAHYVELFNPTPKDISYADMGPHPRIIIANQTPWLNKKDNSNFRPADVRLDLPNNIVIPANGYAVITTDAAPWTASQAGYIGIATNRYLLKKGTGPGTWSLLGTPGQNTPSGVDYEDYNISTAHNGPDRYNLQMNPTENSYNGCRERLLFVNDSGIIDYTLRVYTAGIFYLGKLARNPTTQVTFVADGNTSNNNTNPEASSSARMVRGDPRANAEISAIDANTSSSWKSGNSPQYGNSTNQLQPSLGTTNYHWAISIGTANIWRDSWAEYSSSGNGFIANTNMTSVGELGFIYDPARYNYTWYRTYGRTLRVGQSDAKNFNRNNNSTAANDQNWIGGLGTNGMTSTNYLKNAFMLANVFRTDDADRGKINPNGFFRSDDRTLMRALFTGFAFNASGTFQASGALNSKAFNTNGFTKALTNEVTASRAFVGIGDVSRLDVFSINSTTDGIAANQSMSDFSVSDGDREEVYRRIAGLLNTQSLGYSIYVVGQSGRFVNNEFKVNSTSRKQTVVQFRPDYGSTNYPARPSSWTIIEPWQINLN